MHADHAYVLTPRDVRNIRSYVQAKYAAMPHEKRAEIVADAVTRIIHKQLPDFDDALKRQLTGTLIRTTVLDQQRAVTADDIYCLCMDLDHTDEGISLPLQKWVRNSSAFLSSDHASRKVDIELNESNEAALELSIAGEAFIRKNNRKKAYLYGGLSLCLTAVSLLYGWSLMTVGQTPQPDKLKAVQQQVAPVKPLGDLNGLSAELRYAGVDREKLVAYLNSKDSILAEPLYLDAIFQAAKQFDIHPVLLVAITGQEQAFVPRSHEKAKEIANNPFNVFHSWQEFNTTIEQSSEIAARTIARLSKNKPDSVDPITWINREYAEDPNWSKGVRSIFARIEQHLNEPNKK
ncbi:hypothetical protein ACFQZE_03575 [Paenibacillus sp. GCM10027627]|uniref:hypothetical protein n=1 Tax=unclassified Paenibacillus TaxID=185978 RepID=UPI003641F130